METVLIPLMLFIVLDIAALRWGFDSTEQMESPEWERRWTWRTATSEHEVRNTMTQRRDSNGHTPLSRPVYRRVSERIWSLRGMQLPLRTHDTCSSVGEAMSFLHQRRRNQHCGRCAARE